MKPAGVVGPAVRRTNVLASFSTEADAKNAVRGNALKQPLELWRPGDPLSTERLVSAAEAGHRLPLTLLDATSDTVFLRHSITSMKCVRLGLSYWRVRVRSAAYNSQRSPLGCRLRGKIWNARSAQLLARMPRWCSHLSSLSQLVKQICSAARCLC